MYSFELEWPRAVPAQSCHSPDQEDILNLRDQQQNADVMYPLPLAPSYADTKKWPELDLSHHLPPLHLPLPLVGVVRAVPSTVAFMRRVTCTHQTGNTIRPFLAVYNNTHPTHLYSITYTCMHIYLLIRPLHANHSHRSDCTKCFGRWLLPSPLKKAAASY